LTDVNSKLGGSKGYYGMLLNYHNYLLVERKLSKNDDCDLLKLVSCVWLQLKDALNMFTFTLVLFDISSMLLDNSIL